MAQVKCSLQTFVLQLLRGARKTRKKNRKKNLSFYICIKQKSVCILIEWLQHTWLFCKYKYGVGIKSKFYKMNRNHPKLGAMNAIFKSVLSIFYKILTGSLVFVKSYFLLLLRSESTIVRIWYFVVHYNLVGV